jgi:ATP-dependent exoDNAse (exonuclease V) alpha subunit
MDIDNKQLERDIENAIRARGLKEQMQQWEAERKQQTEHPRISAAASMPSRGDSKPMQKRSRWPKLRRTIYTLSAVAVLAGIVVMAVPTSVWRSSYRQASRWAYQQYAHYFLPSQPKKVVYENSTETLMAMATPSVNQIIADRYELDILGHEDLIQDAAWQIQKANYGVAEQILADAREALSTNDTYYQASLDDIEFLEALCHLGQNRRTKAKKLLIAIAESDSRHREAAAQLAEEIK